MLGKYTVKILKFTPDEERMLSSLENKFLMKYSARLSRLKRKERDKKAKEIIQDEMGHAGIKLSEKDMKKAIQYISGYGIIEPLIQDDNIEEILINGANIPV